VKDGAKWTCASSVAQVRTLDRWTDGSARWVLVDARADLDGREVQELTLEVREDGEKSGDVVTLSQSGAGVLVDTGAARFQLRPGGRFPFDAVEVGGQAVLDPAGSGLVVIDAQQAAHAAEIRTVEIEERGPLRSVVRIAGSVAVGGGRRLDLVARAHFFAGSPTVRLLVTLTNPERASHPGGFWDLGDPGSVLIKDASIAFRLTRSSEAAELYASPEIGAPWTRFDLPFEVYQDSSGGDNWQSSNHINRERRVPTTFRGYRLRAGSRAQAGHRATPIVGLSRGSTGVALTTPAFWQNFPKAVEVDAEGATVTLRLFPGQFGDLHEIQGGEQKTHELFVAFGPDGVTAVPLAWCRTRTVVGAAPEWCLESAAVPFLAPLQPDHTTLVNAAIDGPTRFELKREVVDEYGWRHFGEIYGDHEGVKHKGAMPLVSHYNNQYDPIAGFAYQFLRTGDPRWWSMMSELAAHVVDIDVYHSSRDKAAYSHGMFWHTYHYGDADTATHRTFPRAGQGRTHGGGPSADHNYTTGLMHYYCLTGDEAARATVVDLAQYVIDLDDGRRTPFRWLDSGSTGAAALSASGYYGPGRGPANSLNALLDGHRLTGDDRFLAKAEALVRRVIHPREDIALRRLDVPEQRWFYTMFLQSLGNYLRRKVELGQIDAAYAYGRASLLHYAAWMAEHEHPYLEKPEKLEFPTETWAAQDIRKGDVFALAAQHATGAERARFLERATFFQEYSIKTLTRMPTRALARPVVVLLTSGYLAPWISTHPDVSEPAPPADQPFGEPEAFVPQRARAVRRAMWIAAGGAVVSVLGLWRLLAG
jgi:YetA-like protein